MRTIKSFRDAGNRAPARAALLPNRAWAALWTIALVLFINHPAGAAPNVVLWDTSAPLADPL